MNSHLSEAKNYGGEPFHPEVPWPPPTARVAEADVWVVKDETLVVWSFDRLHVWGFMQRHLTADQVEALQRRFLGMQGPPYIKRLSFHGPVLFVDPLWLDIDNAAPQHWRLLAIMGNRSAAARRLA